MFGVGYFNLPVLIKWLMICSASFWFGAMLITSKRKVRFFCVKLSVTKKVATILSVDGEGK